MSYTSIQTFGVIFFMLTKAALKWKTVKNNNVKYYHNLGFIYIATSEE